MSAPFATLSLKLLEENPEEFCNKIGKSFEESGFCAFSNHTIEESLTAEVLEIFKTFFSFPEEEKLKFFEPNLGGARGYTPMMIETPKGGYDADLKEFWQTGRILESGHKFKKWMPANKWVNEIENFQEKISELFHQFDLLGQSLLKAIANYLDIGGEYFVKCANEGNSVMRSIHYPPVEGSEKGERSGAHEDINLITLLLGGHQPGLEILNKDKNWIPVDVDYDILLCNIGDMLQRFTNHKLISTTHRVVAPLDQSKNNSRYSIPFFVHPNPDWLIETLDIFCTEDNPRRYQKAILAEDFLQQRLKEIKLI